MDIITITLLFMLLMIAVAVGLSVYNHMMRPVYSKNTGTIVENFEEWRINNENQKAAIRLFSEIFWPSVIAVYLLVSFLFFSWSYSWIMLIGAVAINHIVRAAIQLRRT